MAESTPLRAHEDLEFFREALTFTAAETGFPPRLVEKDYFGSVILQFLAAAVPELVFRGGTCLAKVHVGFYRMSEDLDFLISTPTDATRAERSRRAAELKAAVDTIDQRLPGLSLITRLTGANASRQYAAVIGYTSLLGPRDETLNIEVGLREPLLTPAILGEAKALLLDPISGFPLAPVIPVPSLTLDEAMAEKLRAALTRREAAIRDFYDVDYAVRRLGFSVKDPKFVGLVREKLAVPGNEPLDVSAARRAVLERQLESRLRPVLRDRDFAGFDLDRAFRTVVEVVTTLG